ncbi:MAG: DUF2254 domain-containing protein [Kofleriaceae bacterium]
MQLSKLRDRWQTSLWIVPAIGGLLALAAAYLFLTIDHHLPQAHDAWYLFDGGPDSAQHLLSVITTSMLTFTALVFSITVLVLQLASTQFSPRVISTFLHGPTTRWTMAAFVGTFVYAIAVLSQVRLGPPAFVPGLATWFGLVLVLVSVGVFINYIHRMAHAVRVISLITRVGDEARSGIDTVYPDLSGDDVVDALSTPAIPAIQLVYLRGTPGVVTSIAVDHLIAVARGRGAIIETVPRVGDFVASGMVLARVWIAELDAALIARAFTLEEERTPGEDPGCGIRQLVDIALRALSPGINDPTTAVQAIDQLHDLLRRLTLRTFPAATRRDEAGHPRLILAASTFADFVALATSEISYYGKSSRRILDRLRAMLDDCAEIASPARREILTRYRSKLPAVGTESSSSEPTTSHG